MAKHDGAVHRTQPVKGVATTPGGVVDDPVTTTGTRYGTIVGWTGHANVLGPEPQEEVVQEETTRRQLPSINIGMPSIDLGDMNLDHDLYQPTTREVQYDELVENRLTDLLMSDSIYMQQARQAGERAAAQRGALSSSIFAGASQSAAIQAGLPIAAQDAQTYFQTASENMAAVNTMTLAKLQSATAITQSKISAGAQLGAASISASAQLGAAKIAANTQLMMKEMDNDIRKELFNLEAGHDTFMEQLRQEGRIELSELGYTQTRLLTQMGFDHAIDMSHLTHEQALFLEENFVDPRYYANLDFQKTATFSNLLFNVASVYGNGINSMNLMDIDESAFGRGQQFWTDWSESVMTTFYNLFGNHNQFPEMDTGPGDVGPPAPGGN